MLSFLKKMRLLVKLTSSEKKIHRLQYHSVKVIILLVPCLQRTSQKHYIVNRKQELDSGYYISYNGSVKE